MIITVTNDALIFIGILTLIFLPQLHLIFIFAIYAIVEEFGKLCAKIIKFTFDYILPLTALFLLWLIFLKMIIFVYNDFRSDLNPLPETI